MAHSKTWCSFISGILKPRETATFCCTIWFFNFADFYWLNVSPSISEVKSWCSMWWFWEVVGHEGRALVNRFSDLVKETLHPFTMWGHSIRIAIYELGAGPHQRVDVLLPWSWTFQSLWWTVRNKFLWMISYPVYGSLLSRPNRWRYGLKAYVNYVSLISK